MSRADRRDPRRAGAAVAGLDLDAARHCAAVRRDVRAFLAASDAGRDAEELVEELVRRSRRSAGRASR
ncbi:hypothetical protein [Urbifossiella limnaea]|uniref:hypothetical protein n=1 Tax=Urbifossiella limnaea TaxID=2528023 RepID=UPI0011A976AE|nr:hypothetical protein [Urbifossiella limnaea]